MELTDETLGGQTLKGDKEAFGQLIDRYKQSVYATAYAILKDFHQAEDLAQESFLAAYQSLGRLKDPAKFSPWLLGITRHLCLNWLRDHKKTYPLDEQIAFRGAAVGSQPEDDSQTKIVLEELNRLSDDYREVLVLKYMEGLSYEQIAHRLNDTVSAIETRLFRARKTLKENLIKINAEK